MSLPVEAAVDELRAALRDHTGAVLVAPPGAGKSTWIPIALRGEPWLDNGRITMLEPRRIAARAVARRMAELLGESVGETVGYRVRHDTRVGPRTRIEVVTEGVLTRLLQKDPTLEGIRLLIFDEFHERSVHADLGLALALRTRALLRDDLRILVMSATLDGAAVSDLLGDAPVVQSAGRAFSVVTRYIGGPNARIEAAITSAITRALRADEGDVLAFLPGAGEIRRAEALLRDSHADQHATIAPLFGNLSADDQDRAIRASPPGERKVVLSTAIAETSLTIEGVRVVIDSGLSRVPRFSPRSGMTRLETVRVSRASADQRRGRAGRVGPGVCYRLWPEHEDAHLLPASLPEILETDLAPLVLDLAAAGVTDPSELRWLDPPPQASFAQARELLRELEVLDDGGDLTPHGRRVAAIALHPRLAHMLLRADTLGHGALACEVAALLGERDVLGWDGPAQDADLRLRLAALRATRGERPNLHGARLHEATLRRARIEAAGLRRTLRIAEPANDDLEACGVVLALAYPDRIAAAREGAGERFLLRNGRGAVLPQAQALSVSPFLVVATVDDQRPASRIQLAAPITKEEVLLLFADQVERERIVDWDDRAGGVRALERERLGALVLREMPVRDVGSSVAAELVAAAIRRRGLPVLRWSEEAKRLRQRVAFARRLDPSLPDMSEAALLTALDEWLVPRLTTGGAAPDVAALDPYPLLLDWMGWQSRRALDTLAPTHVAVPSGSRLPVDYADPEAPVLAVRLQELFGLADTPRVGGGRVPLTLHLLSPAHRPVQVTRDLASFWRNSYFDVRKDLKGRYPKHQWPDDPLAAEPTSRAKRRR